MNKKWACQLVIVVDGYDPNKVWKDNVLQYHKKQILQVSMM